MQTIRELYVDFARRLKNGDQAALEALFSVYRANSAPFGERPATRLYLSDLGSCPRAVMYRITGAPKAYRSEVSEGNSTMMFGLADSIEYTMIAAHLDAGLMADQQFGIDVDDRWNWGGRGDLLRFLPGTKRFKKRVQIVECKTTRSNAFERDKRDCAHLPIPVYQLKDDGLPYKHHVYQAVAYQMYLERKLGGLHPEPVIWQADRGGANTAREWVLTRDLQEVERPKIVAMMDELDWYRSLYVADPLGYDLPPVLPKVLKQTTKKRGKDYYTKLVYEPDHRCDLCDYAQGIDGRGVCPRQIGKQEWATRDDDGPWTFKPCANMDVVSKYVHRDLINA